MKMKPAITMTAAILVSVLAAGLASAQSPSIIQNTRRSMNTVNDNATAASNEALGLHQATPAAASAKQAPAKSGGAKRGLAVAARHSAQAKPAVVAPKVNPPAAGKGAAASTGGENAESEQSVVPDSKYNSNGRRDPFISPVVSRAGGSGCSTGKKCLEIGAINLRGVVRAEGGFIAVVSNSMNKAYFLRENDPVFNGYVVKITGDSIVFQETLQDRMGKTFTREVVKKITTPAV
jgi:hypothetical protein